MVHWKIVCLCGNLGRDPNTHFNTLFVFVFSVILDIYKIFNCLNLSIEGWSPCRRCHTAIRSRSRHTNGRFAALGGPAARRSLLELPVAARSHAAGGDRQLYTVHRGPLPLHGRC